MTNPSAKVTLHQEFPAEEIKADGTNIIYDVKRGFVYQHPRADHKGVVYCRAESWGAPQISIKYQLLYVEGKTNGATWAPSGFFTQLNLIMVMSSVYGEVPR